MKYQPDLSGGKHPLRGPLLLCALFLLHLLGGGCSSSTEPGGGGESIAFEFLPRSQGQEIFLSDSLAFEVKVVPAGALDVTWVRNRQVVGGASRYRYFPEAVGQDTVEVRAVSGAETDTTYWVVKVKPNASLIPPQVPGVDALAGPAPADVEVVWNRLTQSAFPIVEYLVAVSFSGPIDASNWEQASLLGTYPVVTGQVGYGRIYTAAVDGMVPGGKAWFAVRARDEFGQLSDLDYSVEHDVTYPWFVDGVVADDRGNKLLGVIVASVSPEISDNTDGVGGFRIGPFRNIDEVTIFTTSANVDLPGEPFSSYFDYRSPLISIASPVHDIVLITRYTTDDRCDPPSNPNRLFLPYLRDMTETEDDPADSTASILYRWETYPLTVFIPEMVNGDLVPMHNGAAAALQFWNNAMGEEYFVPTTDEAGADINFFFEERPTPANPYGTVSLLLPAGPDVRIGRVVPQKMRVFINAILPDERLVTEVSLHELGHVLGHFDHNFCGLAEYLMFDGGGLGALDNLDPINIDERRLVSVVRSLPQGVDMRDYQLD